MFKMPARQEFQSRNDFYTALGVLVDEIKSEVEKDESYETAPDWTAGLRGAKVFHISMPLAIAGIPGCQTAAYYSLVSQLARKGKSINRLALVIHDGIWTLWVETN